MAAAESPRPASGMSRAEALALPLTVPVVEAGRALGIGRSLTLQMCREGRYMRPGQVHPVDGDLPVRVLRLGRKYKVPRASLLAALEVPDPAV